MNHLRMSLEEHRPRLQVVDSERTHEDGRGRVAGDPEGDHGQDVAARAGVFAALRRCHAGRVAFAEAFRVMASGGRYAFTCWTPPARNPFMGLILGSVQSHGTLEVNLPRGASGFRFGDPKECELAVSAVGFQLVLVTELPMLHPFITAKALVASLIESTVQIGGLLAAQTAEQRAKIEAAIDAGAKAYDKDGMIAIPGPVVLCTAWKP